MGCTARIAQSISYSFCPGREQSENKPLMIHENFFQEWWTLFEPFSLEKQINFAVDEHNGRYSCLYTTTWQDLVCTKTLIFSNGFCTSLSGFFPKIVSCSTELCNLCKRGVCVSMEEGRSILFLQPVHFLPYLCMKWCSFCLFKGSTLKEKATSEKGTFLPQQFEYCATDQIVSV